MCTLLQSLRRSIKKPALAALFLVNLVLSAYAQESTGRETIDRLTDAIRYRMSDRVQSILASGIDLDRRDRFGDTPVAVAISSHQPELAIQLLNDGAHPNFTDMNGVSPLMQASWNCDLSVSQLLLNQGALIDAQDKDGYTPLMYAASACTGGRLVRLLLEHNANVAVISKSGATPLTLAAWAGNEKAVRLLLSAGADPNAVTEEGDTAKSLSCGRNVGRKKTHDSICTILKNLS